MYPKFIAICIEREMDMKILRTILAEFLRSSQIKVEISGFDMEGFSKAVHGELSRRLNDIQCLAFEDGDLMSDSEKIAAIKKCFEQDWR